MRIDFEKCKKMLLLWLLLVLSIDCSPVPRETSPPLLLLISFDGFRWDYPDMYNLPHFNSLLERGVRVKHIDNSFVTVTFPSHYTIVTGLFEETHGIVGNTMFDPKLQAVTTMDTMNDTRWWSQNPYTQPIWISNQLAKDSNQRRSGVIAWPGVGTPINGYLPYKYERFNVDRKFDSIIKRILEWFDESPETAINFGAIYHSQPDATGHGFGPVSPEMNVTLTECDQYLGQLLQIIDSNEYLKNNLNVIITSDHGMHEILKSHTIRLDQYVDSSLYSAYGGHSYLNIFVHSASDIDRLYANLSVIPNYEVYKKAQIPDEYHYKSNVRIGDILMVGKVGYDIVAPGDAPAKLRGDHGFDNRAPSMHPICYAFGPAFRRGLLAEPFRNVDLYPLMSYVLRLEQRPTNGSLDNVKHILVDFPSNSWLNKFTPLISMTVNRLITSTLIVVLCVLLVILMGIIYAIVACRHARHVIVVEPHHVPVHYRLLSNLDESTNDLVASGDEEEEEIEHK